MALTADEVQTGEVDILQGDGTSGTISITGTVEPDRTLLVISSRTPSGSERPARQVFKVRLSESNPGTSGYDQITWERNSNAFASTQTLRWSLIEFTDGVADVYQGEADPTSATTNVAIGATPSANSVPFVNFTSSKTVYFDTDMAPEPTISGSNLVLTFGVAPAAGEWDVDWQVIDFLEGVDVQTGSVTVTGSTMSGTDTITAVTIADCIVLVHSCRTNTSGYSNGFTRGPYHGDITSTTQVTMTRGPQGSGGESVARYYVLEFTDSGIILETGSATITDTGTSITATLSSITDPAISVPMSVSVYGQREAGDSSMQVGMLLFTQRVFDDSGTEKWEGERGKAGGSGETLECHYSVVQWPAPSGGPTTHSVSVSEGVEFGDSPVGAATFDVSVSEGIDLGDNASAARRIAASVTEGLDLGDSPASAQTFRPVLPEGIEFGDVVDGIATLQAAIEDGILFGDTWAGPLTARVSVAEGIDLGDAWTATVETAIQGAVAEGGLFGDAFLAALTALVSVSEGLTLAETWVAIATYRPSITEGIVFGDTWVAEGGTTETITENTLRTPIAVFQPGARAATYQPATSRAAVYQPVAHEVIVK